MADKVKYPTAESAMSNKPTAYQSTNQRQVGANIYDPNSPAIQPYLTWLNASDDTGKSIAWQNLYRGLVSSNNMAPQGSAYKNNFEYLQALLRKTGLSKGTTPISVLDPKGQDQEGLRKALIGAISMNLPLNNYLDLLVGVGVSGTGAPKQVDTATKYNKQIATALQLKDENEAKQMFMDAYFKAYGMNASSDLAGRFGAAWNKEAKNQQASTTTSYVTTYNKVYDKTKPIIDPKTKKPKLDSKGNPMYQQKSVNGVFQWEPVTKQTSITSGEGFTAEEQDRFLAEYLMQNFPDADFDTQTVGGAARSVYDEIVSLHKNNFQDVPKFTDVTGTIKGVLSSSDAAISKEVLDQYARKLRDNIATKYMSLADWVNAGNDAAEKVNPLLSSISQFLESDVTLKDDLMKRVLNFQGSDGKYRLPNEYELNQLLVNDSRYNSTSTAKNESINMAQTLMNRLRIG
jgi:hypothetical protein